MLSDKETSNKSKKLSFWLAPLVLAVAIVVVIAIGASREVVKPPKPVARMANVEVVAVDSLPFDEELLLPARIMASETALISPEFGGRLSQWKVKEGQEVKAGEIVALQDTTSIRSTLSELEAARASARASVEAAERGFARAEKTHEQARRDAEAVDLDLEASKSALKLAQSDFERTVDLVKKGVLAKAQLDRDEDRLTQSRLAVEKVVDARERAGLAVETIAAAVEEARAATRVARAALGEVEAKKNSLEVQLDKLHLRAPISGVVEEHLVKEGEFVGAGKIMAKIYDLSSIRALVNVPDRYVPFLDFANPALEKFLSMQMSGGEPGVSARIILPGLPKLTGGDGEGISIAAKVGRIAQSADPASNTFTVELEAENPGHALRQGMIAKAHIKLIHFPDAVIIPISSVLVTDRGPRVLVVEAVDGKDIARPRPIEPASISGDIVHVASGLEKGERLIVRGWDGVIPGEPVNVIKEDGRFNGDDSKNIAGGSE